MEKSKIEEIEEEKKYVRIICPECGKIIRKTHLTENQDLYAICDKHNKPIK